MLSPKLFVACLILGLGPLPTQAVQKSGLALQFSLRDQPMTVTVSGVVRDQHSGNPVPNATVRAHIVIDKYLGPDLFEKCPFLETNADANGIYRLTFVTPLSTTGPIQGNDTLCVDASAPGYGTQPQYARPGVSTRNCDFTNLDFSLKPGKRLSGIVTRPDGTPVGGALIRIQNGLNGDWNHFGSLGRALTADDGSFELWIGASGADFEGSKPWLSILKQGSGTRFVFQLLERGDLGTLVLNPGGELTGKVVDPEGNPVPNCEVSGGWGFLPFVDRAVTDKDGRYRLRGLPGEAAIREFVKTRDRQFQPQDAVAKFYARPSPQMELKDAPNFQLTAQDGQTITAPDLVVGNQARVSGTLLRSRTALSLGSLLVRLDSSWENMVEADIDGNFSFPYVSPGKHMLTAYLPHNLRYDRGIGKTNIEVLSGTPLDDVAIQLADLAELRVQYLDANGNPLADISAAATRSKNGEGGWTEGTISDNQGWAVLYLYPDSIQYVGGFDRSQKLIAELRKEIEPQPGQVMDPMQIVMVPTAGLSGRLVSGQGKSLASMPVACTLSAADGTDYHQRFTTDPEGSFKLQGITPGILRLSFEIEGVEYADALGKALEVSPAALVQLGTIVLKNGLNKANVIQQKHTHAMENTQEIRLAAEDFFNKIRGADYAYFLKPNADWQRFPIYGFYQTHHWFDTMVTWMSSTFKTNPITDVELGQVFANPKKINGVKGLPTVPYRVTLKNGTVLQGNLPFEYNFDLNKGHWHGLEGVDWHLQYPDGLP